MSDFRGLVSKSYGVSGLIWHSFIFGPLTFS